jgi:hypothetical protein
VEVSGVAESATTIAGAARRESIKVAAYTL